MNVDIIIPAWNQADLTVRCLETIREHTENYRIVLVDNGSEPDQFDTIRGELDRHPYLLIRNRTNSGFVKATNQGICASDAELLVFMNNDTEAVAGWIERITEPLSDLRVGAVGPLTTTRQSWQGLHPRRPGWRILDTHQMVAFFCVLLRRDVVDAVGPLDEDFGVGFGDDDDYCDRIHRAGYRIALAHDLVIPHHHRTSFKQRFTEAEIETMQSQARGLAAEKARRRRFMIEREKIRLSVDPSVYPKALRARAQWIVGALADLDELPALILGPDPRTMATVVLLADLEGVDIPTYVLTVDGDPVSIPGQPEVEPEELAEHLNAICRLLSVEPEFLEVGRDDPVKAMLTAESLPGTLLVGPWPEPHIPSPEEYFMGRQLMSAFHNVPEDVLLDFLSSRNVLPKEVA